MYAKANIFIALDSEFNVYFVSGMSAVHFEFNRKSVVVQESDNVLSCLWGWEVEIQRSNLSFMSPYVLFT